MLTRKQIYLRSLGAGILAGLAASAFIVWKQLSGPPPPQFPILLPETVSWANHSVTLMPDGSTRSLVEAFVADGKNFRLEVSLIEDKPPVIWVYDGHKLAVNITVPEKPYYEIDPRNTMLEAFESLQGFVYLGVRSVGDHACWAFEKKADGLESRFWVDVASHVPRQVIIIYPDGRKDTQTYVDLPSHRTRQPGLFDTKNLNPLMIPSAKAMLQLG